MKVPFTWRVTGWFMIGWSAEFPAGETRPLRYFGEDLVAYRDDAGELHLLSGHCRHLGAHIGHGGKVVGDCVECPFHGWRWGPDGTNRFIPYQPDRPNRALKLRVFPVDEQHGCVFLWHQPQGKEPQWDMPDIFTSFPQFETDPSAYYRPYPEFSRRTENEPVHPQIVAENGPDSAHFHYVHGAKTPGTGGNTRRDRSETAGTFRTGRASPSVVRCPRVGARRTRNHIVRAPGRRVAAAICWVDPAGRGCTD